MYPSIWVVEDSKPPCPSMVLGEQSAFLHVCPDVLGSQFTEQLFPRFSAKKRAAYTSFCR